MTRRHYLLFILGLIYVAGISIYWLQIGGIWGRDIIYLVPPMVGTLAGIYALKQYGFGASKTKTLTLFTLGMGFWFVGEAMWNYYELILKKTLFPSAADIFYLLAYPLLFLALINEVSSSGVDWRKIKNAEKFLLIISSIFLAILVLYFGVFAAYDPHETIISNLIAIGYGIGDLILILANMFVLVMVWEFSGGRLSRVWTSIFVGFLLMLIADILFAIFTPQYSSQVFLYKSFIDSIYMLSYLFFAYGLFDFGFSILDAREKIALHKPSKKPKTKL